MKSYKLLTLTLFTALSFISVSANTREPSVEPVTEVDIESQRSAMPAKGYDFNTTESSVVKSRVPANITLHQKNTSSSSYIWPFLIFLALPVGIWFLLSRVSSQKVHHEILNMNLVEAKKDDSELINEKDDVDFPKAS